MNAFLDRYATAFGRSQATVLRLSGLTAGEVRASGAWVEGGDGRAWLDFGSFGIHLLGHRHPEVVAAARDQLDRMGLSTKVLGNEAATRCANALLEVTPAALDRVVFATSGSEAVDFAVRLATRATGRERLVALRRSYHGRTAAGLALSDTTYASGSSAYDVSFFEPVDVDGIRERLGRRDVAAVFVEPVQGEGGIRLVGEGALTAIRRACEQTGTLLVLDEIQTGLGRCGRLWRGMSEAVCPDALLVGKTLGGGVVPSSAVLFSSAVVSQPAADPLLFASSCAGGALAGRVGEIVVRISEDLRFLTRVNELGGRALSRVTKGLGSHSRVLDVRGAGLMLGIELDSPGLAGSLIIEAARHGLLLAFCLNRPEVIRFYPPAVTSDEELETGLQRLEDAFANAVAADPHVPPPQRQMVG